MATKVDPFREQLGHLRFDAHAAFLYKKYSCGSRPRHRVPTFQKWARNRSISREKGIGLGCNTPAAKIAEKGYMLDVMPHDAALRLPAVYDTAPPEAELFELMGALTV